MCLEKTLNNRIEELERNVNSNREKILELRKQNDEFERAQEELKLVLRRDKKISSKAPDKKAPAKKAPAKKAPAKKAPAKQLSVVKNTMKSAAGTPGSLTRVMYCERRARITCQMIFDAFSVADGSMEGLSSDHLLTAINASIPNKKDHINNTFLWSKIRSSQRSPFPEYSKLFTVTGSHMNYKIHLDASAVTSYQRAS
jgi:hypothetical protein